MNRTAQLTQTDLDNLWHFHAKHFSDANQSAFTQAPTEGESKGSAVEAGDDLGYYDDGVKRTLTDDQVAMFRHSEIQRLLSERRAARTRKEEYQHKDARRARQDPSTENRPPKRKYDDDGDFAQQDVQTLVYDDEHVRHTGQPKQFLWPKLES